MRLAEGIAADFYAKDADRYYKILLEMIAD